MPAGVSKTACPAVALVEFVHLLENRAYHRDQHQLRDALTDAQGTSAMRTQRSRPAGSHRRPGEDDMRAG